MHVWARSISLVGSCMLFVGDGDAWIKILIRSTDSCKISGTYIILCIPQMTRWRPHVTTTNCLCPSSYIAGLAQSLKMFADNKLTWLIIIKQCHAEQAYSMLRFLILQPQLNLQLLCHWFLETKGQSSHTETHTQRYHSDSRSLSRLPTQQRLSLIGHSCSAYRAPRTVVYESHRFPERANTGLSVETWRSGHTASPGWFHGLERRKRIALGWRADWRLWVVEPFSSRLAANDKSSPACHDALLQMTYTHAEHETGHACACAVYCPQVLILRWSSMIYCIPAKP